MTVKISKIIIKIVIVSLIFQMMNIPVVKAMSWKEIFSIGDEFVEEGKDALEGEDKIVESDKLKTVSDNIYNILLALGVVLSVIVGGILGVQMMWGSIEQQAKAKEMLMPYGVGCVVIFGAFGIWKICVTIFSQL